MFLLSSTLLTATTLAQTTAPTALPPVKPADAKGDIKIGGSPSVYPLTQKISDQFTAQGFAGKIAIDQENSTKGIERLCKGEHDLISTVRAMKQEELDACKKSSQGAVELKIGIDAVVFAVSRQNRFVDKLTRKQLQEIWSGKARTWKDVDPRWPAEPIALFSPAQSLATYDFITEQLFKDTEKDDKVRKDIIAKVPGVKLAEQFQDIAKKVALSKTALGFFSYSFYSQNRAKLRTIVIDDVIANDITVPNGKYQLSRTMYIVTAVSVLKGKPQVKDYVNYYLTNVKSKIVEVGYFAQPDKVANEVNLAFLSALK